MNTQNPENYKWGLFYFNREDPRAIVPKVNQWMGWTLNFARPEAYLIMSFYHTFYLPRNL